jgi:hypothetical protein
MKLSNDTDPHGMNLHDDSTRRHRTLTPTPRYHRRYPPPICADMGGCAVGLRLCTGRSVARFLGAAAETVRRSLEESEACGDSYSAEADAEVDPDVPIGSGGRSMRTSPGTVRCDHGTRWLPSL